MMSFSASHSKTIRTLHVLMVEDVKAHAQLASTALSAIANCKLTVIGDGEAAIRFLRQEGEFADVPRPDLVLLDLGLPIQSGSEVLREMKQTESLKSIPVVVLTCANDPKVVRDSYELHANAFVIKPGSSDEFVRKLDAIVAFWLQSVRLPTSEVVAIARR